MVQTIPDELEKYVYYSVVLLPGFVVLGVILYATGQDLPEFAFTYIAVTLSVGIYFLADLALAIVAKGRATLARVRLTTATAGVGQASQQDRKPRRSGSLVGTFVATTLVSVFVVFASVGAIQSEHLLGAIRWAAPYQVDRVSSSNPLLYLVRNEARLHEIDERPTRFMWNQLVDKKSGACERAPYATFARVVVDGKTIEGRVSHYNSRADKHGFPLLLSPACRVIDGTPERQEAIPGPGVVLFEHELKAIEFREMYASGCWKLFNPNAPPPVVCAKP